MDMDKHDHHSSNTAVRGTDAWPAGLKKTASRKALLRLLASSDRPLDANEICRALEAEGETVWLSTVYRNLEAFREAGLVEAVRLPGQDTVCYTCCGSGHLHYAVCVSCHRMIPLKHCPLDHSHMETEDEGFRLSGHRIELYGVCSDCQKKDK